MSSSEHEISLFFNHVDVERMPGMTSVFYRGI